VVVYLTDNELEPLAGVLNNARSLDGPSVDHSTRCRGGRPPTPGSDPADVGAVYLNHRLEWAWMSKLNKWTGFELLSSSTDGALAIVIW